MSTKTPGPNRHQRRAQAAIARHKGVPVAKPKTEERRPECVVNQAFTDSCQLGTLGCVMEHTP